MKDETLRPVLDWVNAKRAELKLEPLEDLKEGYKGDACNCPISNSLRPDEVKTPSTLPGNTLIFNHDGSDRSIEQEAVARFDHTLQVARFVEEFDSGKHPEYRIER